MNPPVTLLTLPPHLIQEIVNLVEADLPDLHDDIQTPLKKALADVADFQARTRTIVAPPDPTEEADEVPPDVEEEEDEETPPTIDIDVLERLAKWADSKKGRQSLKKRKLDPNRYLLISLLAGTQVWIPPKQRVLLSAAEQNPDKPNPYLPIHLSRHITPHPSPLRALNAQLTTILNVLFSIFGSGFAVFIASITGAGYSRERGVILGILAGVVVGLAEGVLYWIYMERVWEGREVEGMKRVTGSRGSGGIVEDKEEGVADANLQAGNGFEEGEVDGKGVETVLVAKKTVRLRRRALGVGDATLADST